MKKDDTKEIDMYYIEYLCECSVYEAVVDVGDETGIIWYYFKVECFDGNVVYYGNNYMNLGGLGDMYNHVPDFSFQITVYGKDYKTPEWFKNSVAYQIFVDRFYNPTGKIEKPRLREIYCGESLVSAQIKG